MRLVRLTSAIAAIAMLSLTQTDAFTTAAPAEQQPGQGAAQELPIVQPVTPTGRVAVLIELKEASAAAAYAEVLGGVTTVTPELQRTAALAGQVQAQRAVTQQQQVASAIAARGIVTDEIFRVQKAMNAIAAEVDGASIAALRALPGVKAVHPLQLEYPDNSSSVPSIGAPPVWGNTIGLPTAATGAGIRIGVIDTGIDYLHSDFGGTGALTDYQTNNRTVAPDAYFPTAKVVGGTDFAGDNYNGTAGTIAADPDPMDCSGHGSHVAGSAAGYGVQSDGTTFPGPYGPSTPFSSLRIGPGAAPAAQLYALRVFGCGGGTNLTVQAIDWATDPNGDADMSDHLDVINMSLGSPLGSLTSTTTIAAENAAAIGIIVVASAGNNGDTYNVNGSPSVSSRTLAVAATSDPGNGALALLVNSPAGIAGYKTTGIPVSYGVAPAAGGVTGNVVQALDPADGAGPLTTDGCSPLTNAAAIAGNIAFVDRGTCGFTVKTKNAQDAGAIGVIVANNVAGAVGNLAGVDPTVTISTFIVSQTDGNAIRTNLASVPNVTLFNGGDMLASFSSRGPGPMFRLKPDIAAPGYNITSAQTGTTCTGVAPSTGCNVVNPTGFIPDNQTVNLSGTSMAAPHMAGVMALMRQLHPDWSVEQLKALVMNTATHDVTVFPSGAGARYGAGRVGAGRVDVSNAALSNVVAFNASDAGAVSVSFDTHYVQGTASEVKTIRIVNSGSTPQTYDLGVDTVVDAPGMSFSLPGGSSVIVPANSAVEFDVQLDADAALMDHAREATVAGSQTATGTLAAAAGTQNRHWITEENGYVTFSQGASLKLRVPLYAMGRPASAMAAGGAIVTGGAGTGSTTLPLSGTNVCTGTLSAGPTCTGTFNAAPFDVTSLVTPLELQAVSPRNATIPASADIQYGGVAFDGASNKMMFGVSMWGPWSTPSDTTVNVYIDVNNDGTWDAILFDANTGTHGSYLFGNTTDPQDTFINLRLNTATNGIAVPSIATGRYVNGDPGVKDSALFNSSVRILSAAPSTLGIVGPFHYKFVTCPGTLLLCKQFNGFQYDEVFGPLPTGFAWDTANQGLNFSGTSLAQDLNGGTLPVTWNTANLASQGSPGALLLHHHNGTGAQAEFVPMEGTVTTDLSIAMSSAPPSPAKGSTVTLTVTASNVSSAAAAGAEATVELPAGLTYVSDDGGGSFTPGTDQWVIGALAGSASATLHITATVDVTDLQLVSAFVSAASPLETILANNQTSVNVLAPRDADLLVTSLANNASIIAGNPASYTVTVKNNGDDDAFNVVVSQSVSAGAGTLGSGTPSAGAYNAGTGSWILGSLPKGVTQTLTVNVTPSAGPTFTLQSQATSGIGDVNTANNAASASTGVTTRATVTAPSLAGAVTAGQPTPVTVLVTDTEGTGTKANPSGSVTVGSSILTDTIVGPCVLAPVPLTTDQASCQVSAQFNSGGPRTITATYVGSFSHTTSASGAGSTATCSFDATATSLLFDAAGGSKNATVATASGCPWTSSSDSGFMQITAGDTGTGNGTVTFQLSPNPDGAPRSALLTVAGETFPVTQAGAVCTFDIASSSATYGPDGGIGAFGMTTLNGCNWNANSHASFLTVTSAATGTGNTTVNYSVAPNPSSNGQRSGTMTIGDETFTVTQTACGFSISPTGRTHGPASATDTVSVTTQSSCAWTAASNAAFMEILTGFSGSGNGTVTYGIGLNAPPNPDRSGTLTIAGQTFSVTQTGCSFSLAPGSQSFGTAGGAGSVTVTTQAGCGWLALSNASFITVTAGADSVGPGAMSYQVQPNSGPPRTGTLMIAGQTFTVTQAGIGSIALNRSVLAFGAVNTGVTLAPRTSAQTVAVQSIPAGLTWTATADQPWIEILSGSGTGAGTFTVGVKSDASLPPTGTATGTVTVAAPGAANSPLTIAVRINLYAPSTTGAPAGVMDAPINGVIGIAGSLSVGGWALDDIEVSRVAVYRDAVTGEPAGALIFVGDALFVPDARPDVETAQPGVPLNYRGGWGLIVLTNVLPGGGNGPYTLRAYAEDVDGHITPIGASTFTAVNATSTTPFGTIDTPAPGQVVSGTVVNFGWALTPMPKTIPQDGSTIDVFIDSVLRGHPSYNNPRSDIAALFPGLNNSTGPVGVFLFDSTTLTNGLHSISWVVRDDANAAAGIGSRYFTVQNSGGGSLTAGPPAASASEPELALLVQPLRNGEVGVRRGFDTEAPIARLRATDGVSYISAKPHERLEVHLPGYATPVTGYQLVGGERRDLPGGSTLDAERGVFHWQPGAGFSGRYVFVFVRGDDKIRVVIDLQ